MCSKLLRALLGILLLLIFKNILVFFYTVVFYWCLNILLLVNQNQIILYASFTAVFCNFFYRIIGF
jgi:hypothetical protein